MAATGPQEAASGCNRPAGCRGWLQQARRRPRAAVIGPQGTARCRCCCLASASPWPHDAYTTPPSPILRLFRLPLSIASFDCLNRLPTSVACARESPVFNGSHLPRGRGRCALRRARCAPWDCHPSCSRRWSVAPRRRSCGQDRALTPLAPTRCRPRHSPSWSATERRAHDTITPICYVYSAHYAVQH